MEELFIGVCEVIGFTVIVFGSVYMLFWLYLNYKRKWRIGKRPIANCYCKDCLLWESEDGLDGQCKKINYECLPVIIPTTVAYDFCSFATRTNPVEHYKRQKVRTQASVICSVCGAQMNVERE